MPVRTSDDSRVNTQISPKQLKEKNESIITLDKYFSTTLILSKRVIHVKETNHMYIYISNRKSESLPCRFAHISKEKRRFKKRRLNYQVGT